MLPLNGPERLEHCRDLRRRIVSCLGQCSSAFVENLTPGFGVWRFRLDEEALCTYDYPDVGANLEARLGQPFSAKPQKRH